MKRWLNWGTMTRNQRITVVLIAVGLVLLAVALAVGIADNLPGLVLAYLAVGAALVAWVHRWRQLKRFLILSGAAIGGFFLSVVLHNLLYAGAQLLADYAVLRILLEILHVAFFLIAVMVCPPALAIGIVGSIMMGIRTLRARRQG